MDEHAAHPSDALRERLDAFVVGRGDESLTFVRRLARENGWSATYAEHVYREYLRFVYLAKRAGHRVTPSEHVDQAWHLHLTYTRSYWQDLCRDTLGEDLHHGPTEGGASEQSKFNDWYGNTLDSYRRLFGEEPDPHVWPAPEVRFANAGDGLWIRRSETVTFPRRRLWAAGVAATVGAAVLLARDTLTEQVVRADAASGVMLGIGVIAVVFIVKAIARNSGHGGSGCGAGAGCGGGGIFGGHSDGGDSGGGGDAGCGGGGCGGGCGGCGG